MESIRKLIKDNHKIALGFAAVLGIYFIYTNFFAEKVNNASLSGESKAILEDVEAARDIIATLNKLKTIDIDTEVITDPRFTSLIDFSEDLDQQAVGKNNPFQEEQSGVVNLTDPQEVVNQQEGETQTDSVPTVQ